MCVFNFAVVRIQQVFRGWYSRRYICSKTGVKTPPKPKKINGKRLPKKQLDKYLAYMDSFSNKSTNKPLWLDKGYSSWCAVRIQAFRRMVVTRRRHLRLRQLTNQVAAIVIQTHWRNILTNRKYRGQLQSQATTGRRQILSYFTAAQVVQLCWRSFCNRRIYQYFRDLIKIKLKGLPADLMRSIIRNESDLFDKASGVHVRFRLGGAIFPPKIFFKIFTHKPVCDVNAFAPRDYTVERPKDSIEQQHNKRSDHLALGRSRVHPLSIRVGARYIDTVVATTGGNTNDWYRRDERNTWRPIATSMFESTETPDWFKTSVYQSLPKPFHFSTMQRKQDILKDKKRRKREWMAKIYMLREATGSIPPRNPLDNVSPSCPHKRNLNRHDRQRNNNNNGNLSYTMDYRADRGGMLVDDSLHDREKPFSRQFNSEAKQSSQYLYDDAIYNMPPEFNRRDSVDDVGLAASNGTRTIDTIHVHTGCMYNVDSIDASRVRDTTYVKDGTQRDTEKDHKRAIVSQEPVNRVMEDMHDGDLLDWTMALDYEDYSSQWKMLGSSLPSDVDVNLIYNS